MSPLLRDKTIVLCRKPGGGQCLLCHTADVSAVWHRRHVCCVTQQTCLLCHTADMSTVSHSRYVYSVAQQTCLLCDMADVSAVSHSRHICCVTRQTRPLCRTADMSAVSCGLLGSCGLPTTDHFGSPLGEWWTGLNHEFMKRCHMYKYIYIHVCRCICMRVEH